MCVQYPRDVTTTQPMKCHRVTASAAPQRKPGRREDNCGGSVVEHCHCFLWTRCITPAFNLSLISCPNIRLGLRTANLRMRAQPTGHHGFCEARPMDGALGLNRDVEV
ncbi:hypothetical protein RRG08_060349 [Elysia crispata]|uniref:Uncharacterized protein n=1 Tax=Elysia crispata TaxID=231223 RepID=A0AAE0ZIC1_9GAST|nr:hypothetical protein RRG08_060349 [Elysia crispata]